MVALDGTFQAQDAEGCRQHHINYSRVNAVRNPKSPRVIHASAARSERCHSAQFCHRTGKALASLPPKSQAVTVVSKELNTVALKTARAPRLSSPVSRSGRNVTGVIYMDFPDAQLRCRTVARDADFGRLHTTLRRSLFSWRVDVSLLGRTPILSRRRGVWRPRSCRIPATLSLLGALFLVTEVSQAAARSLDADAASPVATLRRQLTALSSRVNSAEAARVAAEAHQTSRELARVYRPVVSPQFQNFLVNTGFKQRGLCHHWARDLGERLAALKVRTLVVRWAIARGGTLREHNAVVVTARGQPFEQGIVLDAWRHSGRLFSSPVAADKYPWKEDATESFAPTSRPRPRVSAPALAETRSVASRRW